MRSSCSNGSTWTSDERRPTASLSTWLTKRMIEASAAALSRSPSSPASSMTWKLSSCSSRFSVSAPTPRCFLISRCTASPTARIGCSFRFVSVRRPSRPGVAKSRLHATSTTPSTSRSGSSSSFSRIRAGNCESSPRSGSTPFEIAKLQPVLRREPAEHLLLGPRVRLPRRGERLERLRVHRGNLLPLHHGGEQIDNGS